MKLPKSKLGFLLAAVYIFVAGLFFIYARFVCTTDALYCGMWGLTPILPTIFVLSLLPNIYPLPDSSLWIIYIFALLIGVVLLYFIGALIQKICALIQKRISSKITRIFSIGLIIVAIVIMGILGIRYFNKSGMQPNFSTNINSNSRGYCQQDSDCVLTPQYQGCCTKGCEIEAVNVETKNRDEEARNKICSLKDYSCSKMLCKPHNKQAVCEQNWCVVKEKQNIQTKLQEFEVRKIANTYAEAQGYNLSEYQAPEIVNSKIGEWHLFYDQIYLPDPKTGELTGDPGKHFNVFIDDTTGEVLRLIPGL